MVLDKLVAAEKVASSEDNDCPVHEVDAVVSNISLTYEQRHFRILASILTADDGMHFLLV